jgi:hypothetical protein
MLHLLHAVQHGILHLLAGKLPRLLPARLIQDALQLAMVLLNEATALACCRKATRGKRDVTPRDKLAILAAASRRPRVDERILSTAMITVMAQTADRVDNLSNTFYHMMKVNTDIEDDYSVVPLLSFRTDISKTCQGE